MGKKYLVVEVEERSSSYEPTTNGFLRFLLWIACMAFPPLVFILNIKRSKSTFDEPDAYEGGYFCGPCMVTIFLGLLWSIIMVGLSASDIAEGWGDMFGEAYRAIFAFSLTYFFAYLLDLITAIVVERITDHFSPRAHVLNQKIGNVSIVIVCILFMGGFLATILLGVL